MSAQRCPRCKSADIISDLSARSGFGETSINRKICRQCGYTGEFFPVLPARKH